MPKVKDVQQLTEQGLRDDMFSGNQVPGLLLGKFRVSGSFKGLHKRIYIGTTMDLYIA